MSDIRPGMASFAKYKAQDDNSLPDIKPRMTISYPDIRPMVAILVGYKAKDERPGPCGARDGLPKPDMTTIIEFICPI